MGGTDHAFHAELLCLQAVSPDEALNNLYGKSSSTMAFVEFLGKGKKRKSHIPASNYHLSSVVHIFPGQRIPYGGEGHQEKPQLIILVGYRNYWKIIAH